MFADQNVLREIVEKKRYIQEKKKNLIHTLDELFNGNLEREALKHSLGIELPELALAYSKIPDSELEINREELERLSRQIKSAWEYGKQNFTMPFTEEFLVELAYQIDPKEHSEKGYRRLTMSVRPDGASVTPPYPAKIPLCMARFFETLSVLDQNCSESEDSIVSPVDLSSWMHLHLARIHPFEDCNGRTTRMVQNLYLKNMAYPPMVIERAERKDYINHLDEAVKGFKDRDGETKLVYAGEDLSPGEKRYYDYMASRMNVILENIANPHK